MRKQNFLAHKEISEKETDSITDSETSSQEPNSFKCNLCDQTFRTSNGLKIHKGKSHKDSGLAPTEKLRDIPETPLPKVVSPEKGAGREEQCVCCGELMSPHHHCREEAPLNTNPCPLCHEAEVCHCGDCEECTELISEVGFNTHIMNVHEPPDVKKHYGVDWIHKHKHLISRNYAASAQDRYHCHKWDTFMVL